MAYPSQFYPLCGKTRIQKHKYKHLFKRQYLESLFLNGLLKFVKGSQAQINNWFILALKKINWAWHGLQAAAASRLVLLCFTAFISSQMVFYNLAVPKGFVPCFASVKCRIFPLVQMVMLPGYVVPMSSCFFPCFPMFLFTRIPGNVKIYICWSISYTF